MGAREDSTTKRDIAFQVERYRQRPNAVDHERLLHLVEKYHGVNSAEFFDKERCLPLTKSGGLGGFPWPMHQGAGSTYAFGVLIASVIVPLVVWRGLASSLDTLLAAIIALAVGLVIWFGSAPVVARLFPPKDLAERERLVQSYNEIVQWNRAAAEKDAQAARDARRFRDIIGEADTE